jgi:glutamine synthetase
MEEAVKQKLKDAGIRFIRIVWCDNANVIRAKAAHVNFLEDFVERGVGITVAQQALPVMYDSVVPESGLGPVGEVRLMPDWSTLKILPYAESHALVLSDMVVAATARIWEHCPRGFLRNQVDKLAEKGLSLKASFENEFFLLWRSAEGGLTPADDTVYAATGAMNQHCAFINDLSDALNAQGLAVETYCPESGAGQQELTVRYVNALQAADQQIIYRETARGVAFRHGLVASFLPKIIEERAGSGCHINFSLWHGDKCISEDPRQPYGIGRETRAFVAGVLDHLPALAALTIPSKNSYRRIRPHFWAGAFRAWGHQNREAAVRACSSPDGSRATRFELKTADATANPYLALGALIAAGLDGLQRDLVLPEEATVDPGMLPEAERQTKGMDPLPQNLGEALQALRNDKVLLEALGKGLAGSYLAVKQKEWDELKGLSLEQEVALLAERY